MSRSLPRRKVCCHRLKREMTNGCASILTAHQLHQLGCMVCNPNEDLLALIDKLNVRQSGIENQSDPGYRVLKTWVGKGEGSTLRYLRLVFTEMKRMDLVHQLQEYAKDLISLLLVIHFENKVIEETIEVSSCESIADQVESVVREKYSHLIRKSASTVEILGKEILEEVTCLTFKGAQIDIHVRQNEAMKSSTSLNSGRYTPDDRVANLSSKQLTDLGQSLDRTDYLKLGHILGETAHSCSRNGHTNLIKNWSRRPNATFRTLEKAFIELEKNSLREKLEMFMNDSMEINMILIFKDIRKHIIETVSSQCRLLEIARRSVKSAFPFSKEMLCKVTFQVKNNQLSEDVRCQEYRDHQVHVKIILDEQKDSRNWPSLEVSLFRFCGFRDITRRESENALKNETDGKFVLRYQENHRYQHKGKYAISFVLKNVVYHLMIFEHENNDQCVNDKLYYLTEDGFHAFCIPCLIDHFRTNKLLLKSQPYTDFCLEPL